MGLQYSRLGLRQLGSRSTFLIPRWTIHHHMLNLVCDSLGNAAVPLLQVLSNNLGKNKQSWAGCCCAFACTLNYPATPATHPWRGGVVCTPERRHGYCITWESEPADTQEARACAYLCHRLPTLKSAPVFTLTVCDCLTLKAHKRLKICSLLRISN